MNPIFARRVTILYKTGYIDNLFVCHICQWKDYQSKKGESVG